MYFNDYAGEVLAGRKSVAKGNVVDDVQQYVLRTKRWDRNTGATTVEQEVTTVAKLEAHKASLQAKVAQVNRILADIQKLG